MTQPSPAPLRLFVEEPPAEPPALDLPLVAALGRAFEQATGWELRCEHSPAAPGEVWSTPIDSPGRERPGRIVLSKPAGGSEPTEATAAIELHRARPLGLALANLLGEVNRLRHALWQREAELAAGVPVALRQNEEPHLAERLEAVLKGGADAVGCQAAGLYLLDEHTSQLKLRAAFNLPQDRLLAAPRPLRGAVADLEALVGHAVVLEDTAKLPHWRCPEEFPSAICVPVSSPTAPLGTLWLFSTERRDFSPHATNMVEIVAGRLAADLEREMLLAAGLDSKQQHGHLQVAARWIAQRLPSVAPLIDGYDVAGWTRAAQGVGGDFFDWSVLPDGRLALAVGDAEGQLLQAGLSAATLHAAIKSHAGYRHSACELLSRVSDTLYNASPGDQRAALAYALVEPDSGRIELALAGGVSAILAAARSKTMAGKAPLLGESHETQFRHDELILSRGETLVLLSSGASSAIDPAGRRISNAALAKLVRSHADQSADDIATHLRRVLDCHESPADDLTVLVLRRS